MRETPLAGDLRRLEPALIAQLAMEEVETRVS